jgi:hypothetical protein
LNSQLLAFDGRQTLEQLCRDITHPALVKERVQRTPPGKWCASSRQPGATALRHWACRPGRQPVATRFKRPERSQPLSIERPSATGRGDGLRLESAGPMESAW